MIRTLESVIASRYTADEFPATAAQSAQWSQSRPLAGVRILDGTPLFWNTLAKFIPLVTAGADLTVAIHPEIPHDPAVAHKLADLGITVLSQTSPATAPFDIVMDCAARHSAVPVTTGFIELTHSGLAGYRACAQPVVMIDHSPIKLMETMFGTGESCLRALDELGFTPNGEPLVVIGAGKVGSGIARSALSSDIPVVMVDHPQTAANFTNAPLIDVTDRAAVSQAIRSAWAIVTATGTPGAAADYANAIIESRAVVANMGVDDEFGDEVPGSRVLNRKRPVNYVLAEPTRMRYMDPIFALSNAAALDLVGGRLKGGIQAPSSAAEMSVIRSLEAVGANIDELSLIRSIATETP